MLRVTFRSPNHPSSRSLGAVPLARSGQDLQCITHRESLPKRSGSLPISTTGGWPAGPFQRLIKQLYNCLAARPDGGAGVLRTIGAAATVLHLIDIASRGLSKVR